MTLSIREEGAGEIAGGSDKYFFFLEEGRKDDTKICGWVYEAAEIDCHCAGPLRQKW